MLDSASPANQSPSSVAAQSVQFPTQASSASLEAVTASLNSQHAKANLFRIFRNVSVYLSQTQYSDEIMKLDETIMSTLTNLGQNEDENNKALGRLNKARAHLVVAREQVFFCSTRTFITF